MRCRRLVLVFALTALSGCSDSESFKCGSAADCLANGVQGICTEIEKCAYPDSACETGYSFPPESGSLGGMCVPTQAGSSSSGVATDSTTNDSTSSGPSSTGMPSSGPGGSTGQICEPDGNDMQSTPTALQPDACIFELQGTVDGPGDVDWLVIEDPSSVCTDDPADTKIRVVGQRTCVYVECSDPGVVYCIDATEDDLDGYPGCCSEATDTTMELGADPPCDPTQRILIRIEADAAAACGSAYSTTVEMF